MQFVHTCAYNYLPVCSIFRLTTTGYCNRCKPLASCGRSVKVDIIMSK